VHSTPGTALLVIHRSAVIIHRPSSPHRAARAVPVNAGVRPDRGADPPRRAVLQRFGACSESDPLRTFPQSPIERITLAGFPPARVFRGTSLVTTEPAATTEFSPTVTPPMMVAPAAIHTFLSITMGFPIT